jgi:ribonuclease HII
MEPRKPQRRDRSPRPPSVAHQQRWQQLQQFDAEQGASVDGVQRIIGVDEVGRGSLIGAVVAVACTWKTQEPPTEAMLAFVNDSKQLSARMRSFLLPLIHQYCHVAIDEATMEEISEFNIVGASMRAGQRATLALLNQLEPLPTLVLMDGRDSLPNLPADVAQRAIIKGDSQSALIAMASIIAKEYRDTWVKQVATHYPLYGWERNMGYATLEHRTALLEHGLSPYHRPSYACLPQQPPVVALR